MSDTPAKSDIPIKESDTDTKTDKNEDDVSFGDEWQMPNDLISDQYPDDLYRDFRDYDMGDWYVSQDKTLTHLTKQPTQIIYSYLCCGSQSNSDCSLDNVVYGQDHEGLDLLICNSSVLVANIFADNTYNEQSSKTQYAKWILTQDCQFTSQITKMTLLSITLMRSLRKYTQQINTH